MPVETYGKRLHTMHRRDDVCSFVLFVIDLSQVDALNQRKGRSTSLEASSQHVLRRHPPLDPPHCDTATLRHRQPPPPS